MYGSIAVRPNSLSSSHLLCSVIAPSKVVHGQDTFRAWTDSKDGFASLESRFLDVQSLLISPVLLSSPSRLQYLPYPGYIRDFMPSHIDYLLTKS